MEGLVPSVRSRAQLHRKKKDLLEKHQFMIEASERQYVWILTAPKGIKRSHSTDDCAWIVRPSCTEHWAVSSNAPSFSFILLSSDVSSWLTIIPGPRNSEHVLFMPTREEERRLFLARLSATKRSEMSANIWTSESLFAKMCKHTPAC